MAAEVVGTAFVRIRAITTGLAKQLENDVKKAASDARADKAGGVMGDDMAEGLDERFLKGVKKTTGDMDKNVDVEGSKRGGDKLGGSLLESFNRALDKGDFKGAGSIISKKISDDFKVNFETDLAKAMGDGDFEAVDRLFKKRAGFDFDGGNSAGEVVATGFLAGLRSVFSRDGGSTGVFGGTLFSGGFGSALKKLAIGAFPAVLGAASALLQYAVALVGQIGFLATGVVGLGAAGAAAFGAIGLAAVPIMLAFKANTPALEKFKDILGDVGHQWQGVGAETQRTLLPGLTEALKLTTNLIPPFRAFGKIIGNQVGEFARLQGQVLFTGDGLDRFRGILMGSTPIVRSLLHAVGSIFDILLNLWRASIPAAQDFAATLSIIFERLRQTLSIATTNGTLTATITEWYERGKLVVGALADIFKALWNVLKIGADSSGGFFKTFDNFAARFRAFTESAEGQNKLGKIFAQANAIAREFNGLITDIVKAISGAVFDGEGGNGIVGFIRLLRDMVPKVSEFFAALTSGGYGSALLDRAKTLGELFKSLDAANVIGPGLVTFTLTLQLFTGVLDTLLAIPGFGVFISYLLGFVGALKALQLVTGVNFLGKIAGELKNIKSVGDITTPLKNFGKSALDVSKKAATMAADVVVAFAKMVASAVAWAARTAAEIAIQIGKWIAMGVAATVNAAIVAAAWTGRIIASAVAATASMVAQVAVQVGAWIALAAAAAVNAAAIAVAWLISMGPLILVGAAVVALVVLIVKNWEAIKNAIVTAATFVLDFLKANWPTILAIITGPIGLAVLAITRNWDTIKAGASAVWEGVRSAFTSIVGFISGLPGKIASAASGMWNGITSAFKSAINAIIRGWNSIQFRIPGFKVGPIGYDGFTLGVPDIPLLGLGGIFKRATQAVVGEDGAEAVLPLTKPNVMRALLRSNPAVAQAIMAAMPKFESALSTAGAAFRNATTIDTKHAVSSTGMNVTIAAGAILVNLQNGSPEEAYEAGRQVAAGLNAALAERRAKVDHRAV